MRKSFSLAVSFAVTAALLFSSGMLPFGAAAAQIVAIPATAPVSTGFELILVELKGCPLCARWKSEVMPGYARSRSGRAAPLRVVQFDGPWPDGLTLGSRPVGTPTFILVRNGVELSRMEGYSGARAFASALDGMLFAAISSR